MADIFGVEALRVDSHVLRHAELVATRIWILIIFFESFGCHEAIRFICTFPRKRLLRYWNCHTLLSWKDLRFFFNDQFTSSCSSNFLRNFFSRNWRIQIWDGANPNFRWDQTPHIQTLAYWFMDLLKRSVAVDQVIFILSYPWELFSNRHALTCIFKPVPWSSTSHHVSFML